MLGNEVRKGKEVTSSNVSGNRLGVIDLSKACSLSSQFPHKRVVI